MKYTESNTIFGPAAGAGADGGAGVGATTADAGGDAGTGAAGAFGVAAGSAGAGATGAFAITGSATGAFGAAGGNGLPTYKTGDCAVALTAGVAIFAMSTFPGVGSYANTS